MTEPQDATAVTEVRAAHAIDEGRLAEYLKGALPDAHGPMRLSQFAYGQSNPTYVIAFDDREYVLRKQPPGELLPSAHAVDREYKVIRALGQTDVPVAKAYALCEVESDIAQVFYIMEFMQGRVVVDPSLPDQTPTERTAMYDAMNDTLAKLHMVDFDAVGLGDYGRVGGYMGRQVSRWSKQ